MSIRQIDPIYPPTKAKGQGSKKGAPCGHQKPRATYNGLYFLHGTGCSKWDDCLTCTLQGTCALKSGSTKPSIKEEEKKAIIPTAKPESPTWKLRACPRCHGALHLSNEPDEAYVCLHCGYTELCYKPLAFTRAKWIGKPEEVIQEE